MHKDVMRAIEGIGLYPVISLVVFFLFFTTVFLWVIRMRSDEARMLADLPLNDDETHATPTPAETSTHG